MDTLFGLLFCIVPFVIGGGISALLLIMAIFYSFTKTKTKTTKNTITLNKQKEIK